MFNRIRQIAALMFLWAGFSSHAQTGTLDRSGPVITIHSDPYQIGDQWYCPLCRKPVEHGDRSHIDPRLRLSEWHDVYIDSSYFHHNIRYITDEELVRSLPIKELDKDLKQALAAKAYDRVTSMLYRYF